MSATMMQSLMLIIFIVSEKIISFLPHADTQPDGRPNTDHYIDSHFSCRSKTTASPNLLSHTLISKEYSKQYQTIIINSFVPSESIVADNPILKHLHSFSHSKKHSRAPKKNTSHGNEVLLQDTTHLIQRPCYQWESPCQDPAGNRTTRRPPDHHNEIQTSVVWSCLLFWSGKNHLARRSERVKR